MTELPSGILHHDHQGIMAKLTSVGEELRSLSESGSYPKESLQTLARDLTSDLLHHFTKEDVIVGLALDAVEPLEQETLRSILDEHQQLREAMAWFQASVDMLRSGKVQSGSKGRTKLIDVGRELIERILQHMRREEQGLFLDADRLLTPEQKREVVRRFKDANI